MKIIVQIVDENKFKEVDSFVYIKKDDAYVADPSEKYLRAIRKNRYQVWG